MEYFPHHPNYANDYVAQHRLVVEGFLGRLLERDEHVHHKNHVPDDNRPENLMLVSPQEHTELHRVQLDEQQVQEALDGRSTVEAADLLGVNHNTLRNRFDHLLTKRTSPGGSYAPEFVEKVQKLAKDPSITFHRAATLLGVAHHTTVRLCCERHGIEWQNQTPWAKSGKTELTEETVREALRGRSTEAAGKLLGYSGTRLRQKFPHLVAKNAYTHLNNPHFDSRVRLLAQDPEVSQRAAAADLGVSPTAVKNCCKRLGIEWVAGPVGRPRKDR